MSFVKVLLDDQSMMLFAKNFLNVQDPLSRVLILRSIYDMTLLQLCDASIFSDLSLLIFKDEGDVRYIITIVNNL